MKTFAKTAFAATLLAALSAGTTTSPDVDWARKVGNRLDRTSPFAARLQNNDRGHVGLAFDVGEDNRATNIRVLRSSGYPRVDRRAVARLTRLGRLPKAPDSVRAKTQFALIGMQQMRTEADVALALADRRVAIAELQSQARLADTGRGVTISSR